LNFRYAENDWSLQIAASLDNKEDDALTHGNGMHWLHFR